MNDIAFLNEYFVLEESVLESLSVVGVRVIVASFDLYAANVTRAFFVKLLDCNPKLLEEGTLEVLQKNFESSIGNVLRHGNLELRFVDATMLRFDWRGARDSYSSDLDEHDHQYGALADKVGHTVVGWSVQTEGNEHEGCVNGEPALWSAHLDLVDGQVTVLFKSLRIDNLIDRDRWLGQKGA